MGKVQSGAPTPGFAVNARKARQCREAAYSQGTNLPWKKRMAAGFLSAQHHQAGALLFSAGQDQRGWSVFKNREQDLRACEMLINFSWRGASPATEKNANKSTCKGGGLAGKQMGTGSELSSYAMHSYVP